jgi:hypothetical protein
MKLALICFFCCWLLAVGAKIYVKSEFTRSQILLNLNSEGVCFFVILDKSDIEKGYKTKYNFALGGAWLWLC